MQPKLKRLSPQDAHAIDVCLNHSNLSARQFDHLVASVAPKRLESATKLLGLLDYMAGPDPSTDLARRTLDRIASLTAVPSSQHSIGATTEVQKSV